MTQPLNYQQHPIPCHSGITINIANPVMNPPGAYNHQCNQCCNHTVPQIQMPQSANQYSTGTISQTNTPQQVFTQGNVTANGYDNSYNQYMTKVQRLFQNP